MYLEPLENLKMFEDEEVEGKVSLISKDG